MSRPLQILSVLFAVFVIVGCGASDPAPPVLCDVQDDVCAVQDFDDDGVPNGEDDFPEDPACAAWGVEHCGGCGLACAPRQMCLDTGLCVCSPGFTGAGCAECANERFTGENCDECSDPRFTGDNCNECAEGFTGDGCLQCTDVRFTGESCTECADPVFTGEDCSECADPTYTGKNCDQCADPTFTGPACDQCANPMFTGVDCAECAVEGLFPPDCYPFPDAPGWFYQVHLPEVYLDEDGESEELYVDLPEDTTSIFVMVRGEEEAAFYTLQKVITPPPESHQVVKGAGDAMCIPCANRVAAAQRLASFLVPNDPEIPIKGGEWTFKIRGTGVVKGAFGVMYPPEQGLCEVMVLARTEPVPETGRLVVHLHFTGSAALTAETALESEELQTGLDDLTVLLASAGIAVEV
ncbi:MAG: hypothetical protein VX938_10340, partial [Myxococcota bacterium]|nr:hypothetical protein [Myxococcota bacterium]